MDIASYLARIDYEGPLEPTLEVLCELHYAHLLSVPFENLDIHLGRPIRLEEGQLFEKIVTRRRGGFCYELNGLFATLLRALGFRVDLLSARVFENGEYSPEFDHLILRVRLEEDWLADVGFGDCFREPLLINETGEQVQHGDSYRFENIGSDWILERKEGSDGWGKVYRFDLIPRKLPDFNEMCRYHQTSPESMFTQKRVCTRATPDGRITLSDMRLIITEDGRRKEKKLVDHDQYIAVINKHFGITFT